LRTNIPKYTTGHPNQPRIINLNADIQMIENLPGKKFGKQEKVTQNVMEQQINAGKGIYLVKVVNNGQSYVRRVYLK